MKPKFKPRKAWAIIYNEDGVFYPASEPPKLFNQKNMAQYAIDVHWIADCHIERVLITRCDK